MEKGQKSVMPPPPPVGAVLPPVLSAARWRKTLCIPRVVWVTDVVGSEFRRDAGSPLLVKVIAVMNQTLSSDSLTKPLKPVGHSGLLLQAVTGVPDGSQTDVRLGSASGHGNQHRVRI